MKKIIMSEGDLASEIALYHGQVIDALKNGANASKLFIPFLTRVAEKYGHPEPNTFYTCDLCYQLKPGRMGRIVSDGSFICASCDAAEEAFMGGGK
jgi:hypothetical protein